MWNCKTFTGPVESCQNQAGHAQGHGVQSHLSIFVFSILHLPRQRLFITRTHDYMISKWSDDLFLELMNWCVSWIKSNLDLSLLYYLVQPILSNICIKPTSTIYSIDKRTYSKKIPILIMMLWFIQVLFIQCRALVESIGFQLCQCLITDQDAIVWTPQGASHLVKQRRNEKEFEVEPLADWRLALETESHKFNLFEFMNGDWFWYY